MQGVATMVLESPFYGRRRPQNQQGSRLLRVSDLLVLGRATIEESLCLLDWAGRQGYGKLGALSAANALLRTCPKLSCTQQHLFVMYLAVSDFVLKLQVYQTLRLLAFKSI